MMVRFLFNAQRLVQRVTLVICVITVRKVIPVLHAILLVKVVIVVSHVIQVVKHVTHAIGVILHVSQVMNVKDVIFIAMA